MYTMHSLQCSPTSVGQVGERLYKAFPIPREHHIIHIAPAMVQLREGVIVAGATRGNTE